MLQAGELCEVVSAGVCLLCFSAKCTAKQREYVDCKRRRIEKCPGVFGAYKCRVRGAARACAEP
eukprot:3411426-Pleurochrysis_carterae.AAC.1